MKKLLFLFLAFSQFVIGQNSVQKWQFNAGMSGQKFMDNNVDILDNLSQFDKMNIGAPLNYLSVSRHLFGGFSPELKFAANKVAIDPTLSPSKTLLANGLFNLKYSLANGYILSQNSFLEPYFKGGAGMTYLDAPDNDKFLTTYDFGGGLALWLNRNKTFGIQLQQLYHMIPMFPYSNNSKDYFEYSASVAYKFGMKDRDKDGIPDDKDECPDNIGTKANKGCPDKDADGLVDKNDDCPDEAGPEYLKGCPDVDGDSIPDKDDKCPDIAGPRIFNGCPDTDNDSVPDYLDSCVKVKGKKLFSGCPDRDDDGIQDKYDACPDTPGLEQFKGCPDPDRDRDSILNNEDECPDQFGLKINNGCPDTVKMNKVDDTLMFKAKSLFFNTGKHQILPKNYPILDEIAEIIKANPTIDFVIEGHTDIIGGEEMNFKLSKNRAAAVKEYLISKGIGRVTIEANGFGMKYPIADNRTEAGRAKNRRVDITVKRQ
jgi:OmpA-OmpF porin, OOP family